VRLSHLRVLGAALVLLAACPKRVMVNGQELPVEQADQLARRELAAEQALSAALPPAERAARLAAFASRWPGVPAAAEALHQAASLAGEGGDLAGQAALLSRLLFEHPLYGEARRARYELALCDIRLGRSRDGLASLASLYPSLPAAERPAAAAAAAQAAEAVEAWPAALGWWAQAAEGPAGPVREQALARGAEVVDGRLTFLEVARAREELPGGSPLLPAVTMKLARVHLHLRDYQRAEEEAREVFVRWPESPWAADARAMVERIGRLTFVRPNVIGVAVPLSGPYKRWGEAILQGIGVGLPEGAGLRLAIRDTRGEPDGSAQAIESLVADEGSVVIIGGVTSAEAERAAATAEELQVPFVSLSKSDGITGVGPWVFQNMLTAAAQARALAEFAMVKRGMRRFALLFPAIAYGTELANAFWDEVEARGGEIRAAESYPIDRTTFTPLVKSMVGKLYLDERTEYAEAAKEIGEKEKDPFRRRKALERLRDSLPPVVDFDAVLILDFARNVKLIAPALAVEDVVTATCLPDQVERIRKATGRPELKAVQLLGANGWGGDPSLFDLSPGGAGKHVRCAVYVDGFHAGSTRPETRRFVELFQRKYGAPPSILEASAFDAVRMARQVLEQGRAQTRQALRDGLASLRGFKGATGDITMGPDRTPQKELFYLAVDKDGVRELDRSELAPPGAGGDG
jgi:ABC-type branched-subunit amino acid transport system substrate-binding protein